MMTRRLRRSALGGWLVLILAAAPAGAKSYRHTSIEQTVTVLPDGRLTVEDRRGFLFDGEFHNGYLTADPIAGGSVDFGGVEAADGKGIRNVRVEGNTVRWQYDALNEERRFTIRYALTGEIRRSADAALFDRLLLEPRHEAVDHYRLHVVLPGRTSLFKVFVITERGLLGDLDVDTLAGRTDVAIDDIRANEWVRVRTFLDPALVPGVTLDPTPRYQEWLSETARDTRNSRDASRDQVASGTGWPRGVPVHDPFPTPVAAVFVVIAAAFMFWAIGSWRRHGTEPEVGDTGPYFREPAEPIPPGAVPYVKEQINPGLTAAGPALASTLLDMARRGYLSLAERRNPGFFGLGAGTEIDFVVTSKPRAADLTSFEGEVLDMLDEARGVDSAVTPKEMRSFLTGHRTWIQEWVKGPRQWYEETHGPLLQKGYLGWMAGLVGLGIVLMAGMIVAGVFSRNPTVFILAVLSGVACGLTGIITGAAMPRWRPEALVRSRKWNAYARFLGDFSAMADAPAEHYRLWDYHFVYATALGVAKSYLANVGKMMAREPERFVTPAWIAAGGAHPVAGAAANLTLAESQLANIQHNLAALETALSATTSAGGGFSGGGAGGASGGGGASGAS